MTGLISCTEECNMACRYCYEGNGNIRCYPDVEEINQIFSYNKKTFINFIDQLYQYNCQRLTTVILHGGEPLLIRAQLLAEIMEDQKEKGHKIKWSIQSNGTLITEEYLKIFKKYNVTVSVSIDGVKEQHDKYRVFKNGNSTFDIICRNIIRMKSYGIKCNALLTITDNNVINLKEIYDLFEKYKLNFSFNALYPTGNEEVKLSCDDYVKAICGLFDYWMEKEDSFIVIVPFMQIIEGILHYEYGIPACSWQKDCGNSFVAIDCKGDLYTCERWIGNKNMCIGHLEEGLINVVTHNNMFSERVNCLLNDQECKNCEIFKLCYGGCPANAYNLKKNIECRDSSICYGRRAIIKHIYRYLETNLDKDIPEYSRFTM